MLKSKITQIYLLTGLYALFAVFVLATFDRELDTSFYLIIAACFAAAWTAILRERLILLSYVNMMALSVFMYSIQRELGPEYLLFRTQNTPITEKAALIIIVHVLCTALGATLTSPGAPSDRRHRPASLGTAVVAIVIAGTLIAMTALIIGTRFYTEVRIDRAIAGIQVGSVTRILEFFSKTLPYILAAALILSGPPLRRAPAFWMLVLLIVTVGLVISNPTNTARFISLSGLMILGIAALYRTGLHHSLTGLIVIMPLVLILALPVTSMMRLGTDRLTLEAAYDLFTSLEFSAFQLFLDAVLFFSDKDLFSTHTLSAIFIWVPRAIWTGKEHAIGNQVALAGNYVIETVSLPSFFNFFADYGFIGLVLGSLAMGWLFARVDIARLTRPDFQSRRQMYGLIILALVPIIARGDMSTACMAIYAFLASYEVVRLLLRLTLGPAGGMPDRPGPKRPD